MGIIEAVILGITQGLTEFIPVSSSGHLTVLPYLFGWQAPSLIFDLALHAGTLVALLWYFRFKLIAIVKAILPSNKDTSTKTESTRLILNVAVATIPAAILGYLLKDLIQVIYKSNDAVQAQAAIIYTIVALIGVGVMFIIIDRVEWGEKSLKDLSLRNAFLIGVAQVIALIRGVSRSGITLMTGQFFGLKRSDAAEFAFLMSIPIMFLTTLLGIKDLVQLSGTALTAELFPAMVGMVTAGVSGFFAIKFLLQFLKKHGLAIFGWYRIAFGIVLLLLVLK